MANLLILLIQGQPASPQWSAGTPSFWRQSTLEFESGENSYALPRETLWCLVSQKLSTRTPTPAQLRLATLAVVEVGLDLFLVFWLSVSSTSELKLLNLIFCFVVRLTQGFDRID